MIISKMIHCDVHGDSDDLSVSSIISTMTIIIRSLWGYELDMVMNWTMYVTCRL